MTMLKKVLLTAAIVIVVLLGGFAAAFYVMIYRPIGSPMMAMVGTHTLETRTLQNRGPFDPPASGALTPEQVTRFVSVEERSPRASGRVPPSSSRSAWTSNRRPRPTCCPCGERCRRSRTSKRR